MYRKILQIDDNYLICFCIDRKKKIKNNSEQDRTWQQTDVATLRHACNNRNREPITEQRQSAAVHRSRTQLLAADLHNVSFA